MERKGELHTQSIYVYIYIDTHVFYIPVHVCIYIHMYM